MSTMVDISESQRAMVAKRLETFKHGDNQYTTGDANLHVRREDAAELLNVSPRNFPHCFLCMTQHSCDI